jgi:hypothetical protein
MSAAVAVGLTIINEEGNATIEPRLGGAIDDFRSSRTTLFFVENLAPTLDKSHFEGEHLATFRDAMKQPKGYVNFHGGRTIIGRYKLGHHHDAAQGQPPRGTNYDMLTSESIVHKHSWPNKQPLRS